MENETKTVTLTKWTAPYAGEAGHTFRRAACGIYVAVSVSFPERTDRYLTEVYVRSGSGLEHFLGYETEVCVHPGAMMHAINAARPTWAEQTNHLAVPR